ncbi:MAG: hypothetical protein AB7S26_02245 [Sandaracinaceae bacterium]
MVFAVIGRRARTEAMDDGLTLERTCPACGELARFEERRPAPSLRVFDVFDYRTQRVLSCDRCGVLVATDEHGPPERDGAEGWRVAIDRAATQLGAAAKTASKGIGPAFEEAKHALERAIEGSTETREKIGENARTVFGDAAETLSPLAEKAGQGLRDAWSALGEGLRSLGEDGGEERDEDDEPESARESDPEKAELLRRFEELERKRGPKPG